MILDERALSAPALAAGPDGGTLHLGWTGSDAHLNLMTSDDGRTFGDKQTLDEKSERVAPPKSPGTVNYTVYRTQTVPMAPALAVTASGLRVAWTGTDSHLNVLGEAKVTLDQRSRLAPALAPFGAGLALAWVGRDRHLNVALAGDAATFGPPLRLDQTSNAAPGLCALGGDRGLALAWIGTDRHINVVVSDGLSFGAPVRLEETSDVGPALVDTPSGVAVAWSGGDAHLNVVIGDGRIFGAPRHLEEKSVVAPALCARAGQLLIAWTGTDRRLNVAPAT